MNIFLLVVKDSTRNKTQKGYKSHKSVWEVQSSDRLLITSYCRFKPEYLMRLRIFNLIDNDAVDFINRSRVLRPKHVILM